MEAFFFGCGDFFLPKVGENKKYVYICSPKTKVPGAAARQLRVADASKGEMPEWSIGPPSKCGVRATVPGVRIPLSPQGTHVKATKNPVNHAFTGFFIFSKSAEKGI